MSTNLLTITGNLTGDPELRFTTSGDAVANFTIASTPKIQDRKSGAWKDGETLFMRCTVWKQAAENVAQSLTRGMAVVAHGKLKSRTYETKEGEKRTVIEMDVQTIGPSLQWASAQVTKTSRDATPAQADPWASAVPGSPVSTEEAPF